MTDHRPDGGSDRDRTDGAPPSGFLHDEHRGALDTPAPVGRPPGAAPRDVESPPAEPFRSPLEDAGAVAVLRRGLQVMPELKVGIVFTLAMATVTAVGKLAVPVLVQQVVDRGLTGAEGFRPGFVLGSSAATFALVAAVIVAGRTTYVRLVRAAEGALYKLRVRVFAHVHELSTATHDENRRGALVARVTSDIDTLARFAQWGGVAWIVNSVLIVGTLTVMTVYSWQLTLFVVVVFLPLLPLLRGLQRRQLARYDELRTRVGETLSEVSEAVTGSAVVRAYALEERSRRRMHEAVGRQYAAQMGAARYFAIMFPLADLFTATALAGVVAVGAWWGPGWGLGVGQVIAFVFLVSLLQNPISELSEVLEQTQTAIAGFRKVLLVLDLPVDVVEAAPEAAVVLPPGPPDVRAEGVSFAYRGGPRVLHDVEVEIPAGAHVAVVGETGSGKTTFVKLLCRLADPVAGRILVGGSDLREIDRASRIATIRMVPQDGFLFDTSILENVRLGRPDATDAGVDAAFRSLGLGWWLDGLPDGLHTRLGERGDRLSVGERQLVALARAQLADAGLLLLDEATSAVDPETERALAEALLRLGEGRTTVTVAHRLSTAERADLVFVFDQGRLIERGRHDELVAAGGTYARMFASFFSAVEPAPAGMEG
jgi:ATP-binding cassette, subfamily B, bacterial